MKLVDQDQRWRDWLYERHSKAELAEWAPSLDFFRYCRAVGGHANDCDELKVVLRYTSEDQLRVLCEKLEIPLEQMPPDAPRPIKGIPYRGDVYAQFISFIDDLPHLRQPKHILLRGVSCYVWICAGKLEVSIVDSSNPYDVTQLSIAGAKEIEPLFRTVSGSIVDPPRDNTHCICPKYYPELWNLRA